MSIEIKLNSEENIYLSMKDVLAQADTGDTVNITMQENDILSGGNNDNGAGQNLNYNISGGTVSGNTSDSGGFVQLVSGKTFSATNVVFDNNKSTAEPRWNGGGAIAGGPSDSIKNSTFISVSNSTFSNNTALKEGGAVTSIDTAVISNTVFNKNISTNSNAGALYHRGNKLTMENVTFTGNQAKYGNAGAVYLHLGSMSITGENNIFSSNTATAGGGAIYISGSSEITNAQFESNSAKNGGAIYNNSNVTLTNVVFSRNTASADGGAIYNAASKLVYLFDTTFATESDTIYNAGTINFYKTNTINASISGSGTLILNNNAALTFDNDTDITLTALTVKGGNTLNFSGSAAVGFTGLDLTTLTITVNAENRSGNTTAVATGVSGSLDANDKILNDNKSHSFYLDLDVNENTLWLKKYDVAISREDAEGNTLGSYNTVSEAWQNIAGDDETIKIVMGENAIIYGGNGDSGTDIFANYNISGGTISGNTAVRGGFAGLNDGCSFTASNVLFTGNRSIGAEDWNGGGAISGGTSGNVANSSTLTISNSIFDSNYSDSNGGAVVGRGTGSFSGVQFTNNKAGQNGGALLQRGSSITFENITVNNNYGGERSGAFYIQMGNSSISATDGNRNKFANNFAKLSGGAIYYNQDTHTISGTDFSGNTSATTNEKYPGGGAIFSNAKLTVTDSTFENNISYING